MDPRAIAARVGIRGDRLAPSIVDCPLCGASGKLEIRSFHLMQCRSCGFIGDIVALHAQAKGESIESTIATLSGRGLLDLEGEHKKYVENYAQQAALRKLIKRQSEQLVAGASASYYAVLSQLNCRLAPKIPESLRQYAIPLSKEELRSADIGLPKDADPVLRWWGKYGAVAIPAYDRADVTGFWLLTQRGSAYLPVSLRDTACNAFAALASFTDEYVFVVDSIEMAVRMNFWAAMYMTKPVAFVMPEGIKDTTEHYSARKTVFWSKEADPAWTLRSRHAGNNYVLFNPAIGDTGSSYPCGGDFARFKGDVERCIEPSFPAITRHLLEVPKHKAIEALSSHSLDASDKAKMLAYATGEDARILSNLLATQPSRVVHWNGTPVTETQSGWVSNGDVISSVVFYLDELKPQALDGDAIVRGSVVYQSRSIQFQERLSVMRKNTAAWLENFAVQRFGVIAYVARPWRNKLIELSQQFKKPTAIMGEQRYGWHEGVLRMPMFCVDKKDVYPVYEMITGPRVHLPTTLSPADIDWFNNESFCKLFLIILKNMWDTRSANGSGWLLINQPNVVDRVSRVFGMDLQTDPSPALMNEQLRDPIMCPTVLGNKSAEVALNVSPPFNMLVSTDALTAAMAHAMHGWPLLSIEHHLDYRCLLGSFHVLRHMLERQPEVTRYRQLGHVVSEVFDTKGKIESAAISLDIAYNKTRDSAQTRLVNLMIKLHRDSGLIIHEESDRVVVDCESFYTIAGRSCVKVPDAKSIAHLFSTTQYLIDFDKNWSFSPEGWHLQSCMVT